MYCDFSSHCEPSKSCTSVDLVNKINLCSYSSTIELWHKRFGYTSSNALNHLKFLSHLNCQIPKICDICHRAKQHRLPFQPSTQITTKPFELLHIDIWGPYQEASLDGARYVLTIVDDFSRATWTFLMHHKT